MACSNERSASLLKQAVARIKDPGLCEESHKGLVHRHDPRGTSQKGGDNGTPTGWESGPSNTRLEGRKGLPTSRQLQKDCGDSEPGVTGAASDDLDPEQSSAEMSCDETGVSLSQSTTKSTSRLVKGFFDGVELSVTKHLLASDRRTPTTVLHFDTKEMVRELALVQEPWIHQERVSGLAMKSYKLLYQKRSGKNRSFDEDTVYQWETSPVDANSKGMPIIMGLMQMLPHCLGKLDYNARNIPIIENISDIENAVETRIEENREGYLMRQRKQETGFLTRPLNAKRKSWEPMKGRGSFLETVTLQSLIVNSSKYVENDDQQPGNLGSANATHFQLINWALRVFDPIKSPGPDGIILADLTTYAFHLMPWLIRLLLRLNGPYIPEPWTKCKVGIYPKGGRPLTQSQRTSDQLVLVPTAYMKGKSWAYIKDSRAGGTHSVAFLDMRAFNNYTLTANVTKVASRRTHKVQRAWGHCCMRHDVSVIRKLPLDHLNTWRNTSYPPFTLPRLNGVEIKLSDSAKYLGVILDQNLSWHLNTQTRVDKRLAALYSCRESNRQSWGINPKNTQMALRHGVKPILLYGASSGGESYYWTVPSYHHQRLSCHDEYELPSTQLKTHTIGRWHMTKSGHSTIINFLGASRNIDYCTPNLSFDRKLSACRFNKTQMRWNLSSVRWRSGGFYIAHTGTEAELYSIKRAAKLAQVHIEYIMKIFEIIPTNAGISKRDAKHSTGGLYWNPGHRQIPGNTIADSLAQSGFLTSDTSHHNFFGIPRFKLQNAPFAKNSRAAQHRCRLRLPCRLARIISRVLIQFPESKSSKLDCSGDWPLPFGLHARRLDFSNTSAGAVKTKRRVLEQRSNLLGANIHARLTDLSEADIRRNNSFIRTTKGSQHGPKCAPNANCKGQPANLTYSKIRNKSKTNWTIFRTLLKKLLCQDTFLFQSKEDRRQRQRFNYIANYLTGNGVKRPQSTRMMVIVKISLLFRVKGSQPNSPKISTIILSSLVLKIRKFIETHSFRGIPPKKWSTGPPNLENLRKIKTQYAQELGNRFIIRLNERRIKVVNTLIVFLSSRKHPTNDHILKYSTKAESKEFAVELYNQLVDSDVDLCFDIDNSTGLISNLNSTISSMQNPRKTRKQHSSLYDFIHLDKCNKRSEKLEIFYI
ncbi:hypothetical protein CVS40_4892 [Lucilia cuprina]|nr:hypothetical protein CVS40_4892 [Lucilia cuprina]